MISRRALMGGALALQGAAAPAHPQAAQMRADVIASLARTVATALIGPDGKGRADYDLLTGQWFDYEPHWHTGQQILALTQAWRITHDDALLAAARRAGDWWIGTAFAPPHPLAGLVNAYHGDRIGRLINFTTISDGTPGLFALSRVTGDPRYADAATCAGAWLYRRTRVPDADQLFYNFIDPQNGMVITDYSPHHPDAAPPSVTQVARPNIEGFLFLDMHRHTRDPRWRARFIAQAEGALRWQDENGLWMAFEPNDAATGKVHPRFNVWNAEALLEAYGVTGDRRFLDAALRTGLFMARVQDRHGAIYYDLTEDARWTSASITGSAVAFSAMLWMRLRAHGAGDALTPNIERALAWLMANRFAEDHPDPNLRGAALETRLRHVDGAARLVVRDIATSFALRCLVMAEDEAQGRDINRGA
ncbi:MAG: hypothetical protein NW203_11730 [Hyphomonadaceae bacterium]|nr:hypothetical protein [Hyphomonadaceae bacterium]